MSQTDLDHLSECKTITGEIMIDANNTGPFALNGVTDFTGRIRMDPVWFPEDMTSFEMLDVVNFNGSLNIRQISDVRSNRHKPPRLSTVSFRP
ncbi:uncharacterized protein BDV17DRAFT_251428 [Aspergillus undulatus]|uniref:uncharacterized protein n=1 Tax=Aspergillus undulatus TaxID=1810928 RepID=UPI003CCCFE7F